MIRLPIPSVLPSISTLLAVTLSILYPSLAWPFFSSSRGQFRSSSVLSQCSFFTSDTSALFGRTCHYSSPSHPLLSLSFSFAGSLSSPFTCIQLNPNCSSLIHPPSLVELNSNASLSLIELRVVSYLGQYYGYIWVRGIRAPSIRGAMAVP